MNEEEEIQRLIGHAGTGEVQMKKTSKIISNRPVDPNEFSYFKKEVPKKKEEKQKPRLETEEDLNFFKSNKPAAVSTK